MSVFLVTNYPGPGPVICCDQFGAIWVLASVCGPWSLSTLSLSSQHILTTTAHVYTALCTGCVIMTVILLHLHFLCHILTLLHVLESWYQMTSCTVTVTTLSQHHHHHNTPTEHGPGQKKTWCKFRVKQILLGGMWWCLLFTCHGTYQESDSRSTKCI